MIRNHAYAARFVQYICLVILSTASVADAKTPIQSTIVTIASPTPAPITETVAPSPTPAPEPVAPTKPFAIKPPNFSLQPFVQLQAWAVQSIDRQAQLNSDNALEPVEQRLNLFFRRARLGFRGTPYTNLNYTLSFFYDNVGHDSLAATRKPNKSRDEKWKVDGCYRIRHGRWRVRRFLNLEACIGFRSLSRDGRLPPSTNLARKSDRCLQCELV